MTIAPIDFSGLRVGQKSEAEYLAGKTPVQVAEWSDDKRAFEEEFRKRLEHETHGAKLNVVASSAPFVIHPVVRWIEPGFYAGAFAGAAHVKAGLKMTGADGKVVDEVDLNPDGASAFTVHQRFEGLGGSCGYDTAEYLKARTH